MNMNLKPMLAVLCALLAIDGPAQLSYGADAPKVEGTIALYYGNGSLQCVFPSVTGDHAFPKDPHHTARQCASFVDGSGYFQLKDFPSAARIFLVNGRPRKGGTPSTPKYCGLNENVSYGWWELRTIKEPTTTPTRIDFRDLRTLAINEVIVPGVRLIAHQTFGLPAKNEINCLIIQASP